MVLLGDKGVVAAWPLGVEGRKRFAGTAICRDSGERVATAKATWIEVPLEAVARLCWKG